MFNFKFFSIKQDRCELKVGTDGVLLGAWAHGGEQLLGSILDIGTGTGVIALMLAQRFPSAEVTAVEIDESAALQAAENFSESPFQSRLKVVNQDFKYFDTTLKFDLIVSNPPYFEHKQVVKEAVVNKSKHTSELSFEELMSGVKKILAPDGCFCAIVPQQEGRLLIEAAAGNGLFAVEKINVFPRENLLSKRVLLRFSKIPQPMTVNSLILHESDAKTRTTDYQNLTKDFYL